MTIQESLEAEKEFFKNEAPYKNMDQCNFTTENLTVRLGHLFEENLRKELPQIYKEIDLLTKIWDGKLKKLGPEFPKS